MQRFHPHIGLRTIKTGIAVALSLLITMPFIEDRSAIFVAFGAILGINRTFRDSLQQAVNQYIGVLTGGLVGVLLVLIQNPAHPLLLGLGIIVAISICTFFRVEVSAITACFLVLYAVDEVNMVSSTLFRLLDTSMGLTIGLIVNFFIKPYNNRPRLVAQLQKMTDSLLPYVETMMVKGMYPNLDEWEANLRTLDDITAEYSRQRMGKKETGDLDVTFFRGMRQLMHRTYHELNILASMDNFGIPSDKNQEHMERLGIAVPAEFRHKCNETTMFVANYHLDKLLMAYEILQDYLVEDAKAQPTPQ